jgi:hypothetical protein
MPPSRLKAIFGDSVEIVYLMICTAASSINNEN